LFGYTQPACDSSNVAVGDAECRAELLRRQPMLVARRMRIVLAGDIRLHLRMAQQRRLQHQLQMVHRHVAGERRVRRGVLEEAQMTGLDDRADTVVHGLRDLRGGACRRDEGAGCMCRQRIAGEGQGSGNACAKEKMLVLHGDVVSEDVMAGNDVFTS
jgi:hypothetical protein